MINQKASNSKSNCDGYDNDEQTHNDSNSIYSDDLKAIFNDESNKKLYGAEKIAQKLQQLTKNIVGTITDVPIILTLYGSTIPTLTLIDIPGSIQNELHLFQGAKEMIQNIIEKYISQTHSIILAVSSANNDLANSDSIGFAKKYDPTGCRTINVLTKIDMMDQGTSMKDLLASRFVERSLRTVCVVNRSQQNVTNKQKIETAKELEREFFRKNYSDIASEHGIDCLTECLVKKLTEQILENLPEMKDQISKTIQQKEENLQTLDVNKDENILDISIGKFVLEYTNLIRGNRAVYGKEIVGGALISKDLYKTFRDQINELEPNHFDKIEIRSCIENNCGNRQISYSIEKTFVSLTRKEIYYFESPSLKCLKRVRDLLQQFVLDILKELNINELKVFMSKLRNEMFKIINGHFIETEKTIKNLVRSEANDLFCSHPNSNFYESFKANFDEKKNEKTHTIFSNIVDNLPEVINNMLPPRIAVILKMCDKTGVLDLLKEYLVNPANVQTEQLNNNIGAQNMTFIRENLIENSKIAKFIEANINEANKRTKKEIENLNAELDVDVLESMIIHYFDQVRQNMIYSVPKWIQTLLIDDLLEHFEDRLRRFIKENPSELLKTNPDLEEKIKTLKNEIHDLNDILNSLWELNRA